MTDLLGLPLETALERLKSEGISPRVVVSGNPRREGSGRPRVVRVSPDGSELAVCLFPDSVVTEDE